jgi:hypothetical protein
MGQSDRGRGNHREAPACESAVWRAGSADARYLIPQARDERVLMKPSCGK